MKWRIALLVSLLFFFSCGKDEETPNPDPTPPAPPTSPVVFDIDAVPYGTLSQYNFFSDDMQDQDPVYGVLPYDVISPLFSDYAKKKRFIWMPEGKQASYVADHEVLAFEDETVLLKTFYYDNVQPSGNRRIIETRLEYKKNGVWQFADYIWNEDQSEAFLDVDGSFTPVTWVSDLGEERSINYRIPSDSECFTCHKNDGTGVPIGPKPQNINMNYDYAEGSVNQLEKWIEFGYLEDALPSDILTTVAWDNPSEDILKRVRSYIDMNCAHCHQNGSHCDYRPMRFAYDESLIDENLGICIEPDEEISPVLTHIVARGVPASSVLLYRLNSEDEAVRMPLLGRSIVHEEGVALIEEWIESLGPPCQ
jgi:uncharacterized repeat protein (TIGR03806 family)